MGDTKRTDHGAPGSQPLVTVTEVGVPTPADHSELNNLDYAVAGHTGFLPDAHKGENSHAQLDLFIDSKGQPSGLCPLGADGLVPQYYLPVLDFDGHVEVDTFKIRDVGFAVHVGEGPGGSWEVTIDRTKYLYVMDADNSLEPKYVHLPKIDANLDLGKTYLIKTGAGRADLYLKCPDAIDMFANRIASARFDCDGNNCATIENNAWVLIGVIPETEYFAGSPTGTYYRWDIIAQGGVAVGTLVNSTMAGAAGGYAALDGSAQIDPNQLPLISHNDLADKGTTSHADIDTFISGYVNPVVGHESTFDHTLLHDLGEIDSGDTLPASPSWGQWFYHVKTGRAVLMQYNGGVWKPIHSFGNIAVFVDKDLGTDSVEYGTGTGSNAYATIAYALSQVPMTSEASSYYIVNISAGTYPSVTIPKFTNFFAVRLVGATEVTASGTVGSYTMGSGSTPGSITDTGAFSGLNLDAGEHYLVLNGATEYAIDTNTDDTITTVMPLQAVPTSYEVRKKTTKLSSLNTATTNLQCYYIEVLLLPTWWSVFLNPNSRSHFHFCTVTDVYANTAYAGFSGCHMHHQTAGQSALLCTLGTEAYLYYCVIRPYVANSCAVRVGGGSSAEVRGCLIDGSLASGTLYGVQADGGSNVNFWTVASVGYTRMKNLYYGIRTLENSICFLTDANYVYFLSVTSTRSTSTGGYNT